MNSEMLYVKVIPLPNIVRDGINEYLRSKNVGDILSALAFKRKNVTASYVYSHIDWSSKWGIMNCSVVIPTSGLGGQVWYDGDYDFKGEQVAGANGLVDYGKITWNGVGNLLESADIVDGPELVRTDLPHNAYCDGNGYRTTCTIRFHGNEDFDTLYRKLST
jgi:hypothetical protein